MSLTEIVHTSDDADQTLSREILGINWSDYFPLQISENIYVELATYDQGMQFIGQHYNKIYFQSSQEYRFIKEEFTESKQVYYKKFGDFFIFKDKGEPVGILVGTLIDWSSYFLRTSAILPNYRGLRLYQKLFGYLLEVLKQNNVQRAEGVIPPTNHSHIHIFNKHGFNITGFNISERWGALIQFTKLLDESNESTFIRQFCSIDFRTQSKR